MLTFIFLIALTIITSAILFMITVETRDIGAQNADNQLLYLAEAGVQRAMREIRDEATSPTLTTGTADLLGSDTTGSIGNITNPNLMMYVGDGTATIHGTFEEAWLRTFNCDYTNAQIVSVQLGVLASCTTGGQGATIEVSYTTNGAFSLTGNTVLTQALTTTLTSYFQDITVDRTWAWATIMSSNFILRARRTSGNKDINLDSMFLRVTYQIDTLSESWNTGYAVFPISLGGGTIQSAAISDESAKVHLNYASTALLTNLLTNLGIASAATKAADIVTYRGAALTNPFDSVEELQQVSSITAADFATIKDYVTVYSAANTFVTRPAGPRVPVNINTASFAVLKAIFDSSGLGAGDSTSLANDIIAARPFVGFYSATSASNTYFYNFARSRTYLSTTGNPDEQDEVLDTADASQLVPVSGSTGFNCPTSELCYATNSFYVNSLASLGGRNFRVKTIVGQDGSHAFANYVGDPALNGYRKRNFE
ncbi:MAG: type II secretion system protein GspK [Candidatus Omnitrophica bacterium]|nr:type II secretion system protein GspK [Candidatus Omnitrophota bacterium]